MTLSRTCPVCGYPDLDEPPCDAGGGPSYEICSSCGFEFGVTDEDRGETYESWRTEWVAKGTPWYASRIEPQPENWDPVRQLAALDGDASS